MPRKVKRLVPIALLLGALHAPAAGASMTQQSVIQDDIRLKANPAATLAIFRELGVDRVRVNLTWATVAPNPHSSRAPKRFNAANPGAYPAHNWAPYDAIVRDAQADGIGVSFTLTSPAPQWALGRGVPRGGIFGVWNPSPSAFGAFVRAVGARYSGSYRPRGSRTALPRVSFWSIWNEPNYGFQLAPQTNSSGSIPLAAGEYRGLLAAAWGGLIGTGHRPGRDTILIGETAPRGSNGAPGQFGGIKPLTFVRALYCVDSRYRQLRGSGAAAIGCPTTAGASRRFRAQNAALFQASGFADHPYTLQGHPVAPNVPTNYYGGGRSDPNYADLPEIPRLEGVLNRLNAVYHSHKHFPIWDTEYGYRTRPPDPRAGVGLGTQAYFMNWAEYLSWRQPAIASFNPYLLQDPGSGVFASGLEFPDGRQKPSFGAFRMPLYLPVTSTGRGQTLELWGDVRPAHFAPGPQVAQIQFQGGYGATTFVTLQTVPITNPQGYFDVRVGFPSGGTVRIAWTPPGSSQPIYSRTESVTIH
jgi:hypothetical protein